MKKCTKCDKDKELTEFYKRLNSKSKKIYQSQCKTCYNLLHKIGRLSPVKLESVKRLEKEQQLENKGLTKEITIEKIKNVFESFSTPIN